MPSSTSAEVAESVVVNAGPLIALARSGALDVVGRLPINYVCPLQVRTELDEGARSGYVDWHASGALSGSASTTGKGVGQRWPLVFE